MLTPRQREICQQCAQRSARRILAAAFACAAIAAAAMAVLWPDPAFVLWALAAADVAIALSIFGRARRNSRRIDELTFFAREARH